MTAPTVYESRLIESLETIIMRAKDKGVEVDRAVGIVFGWCIGYLLKRGATRDQIDELVDGNIQELEKLRALKAQIDASNASDEKR